METVNEALLRIRVEYIEMPDLKLTGPQARRLLNLSQEVCDAALATLVRTGFLWRTPDDRFLHRGPGGPSANGREDGASRTDPARR